MRLRSITLKDVRRFVDPVRIDGITDTFRALTFFAVCALVIPAKAEEADDLEQLRKHAVALVNEARRVEVLTCESACKSDPLGWVMII